MYADDPFFNLSTVGRAGLVALSVLVFVVILALALAVFRRINLRSWSLSLAARLVLALCVLWAFEWLSPQLYYQYFQLIIDGLPAQIVVKPPPSPAALFDLLSFSAKSSISHHSRALLGWALILAALYAAMPDRQTN